MKTDMLLDEETRDGINYQRAQHHLSTLQPAASQEYQGKANKAHSSAAWIMNNHEHVEDMTNPNNFFKAPASQPSADPLSSRAGSSYAPHHESPPKHSKATLEPAESPLAPVPTTINASRQELSCSNRPFAGPQPLVQSPGISEPESFTQDPSSVDHTHTSSTAPSSAAFTPSLDSKRGSDNVYSQSASVADGEWMKQGVERHRQAQRNASPTRPMSPLVKVSHAEESDGATNLRNLRRPASQNRISLNAANGMDAARSSPQEPRTRWQPQLRDSPTMQQAREHPRSPRINTHSPWSHRSSSIPSSRRSSRPGSSRKPSQDGVSGLRETPGSPVPDTENTDIPPVPQLDAGRKSQLGNGSRSPNLGATVPAGQRRLEGDQAASVLEQRLSSIRDKSEEPLSNSGPVSSNTVIGGEVSPDTNASASASHPIRHDPGPLQRESQWPILDTTAETSSSIAPPNAVPTRQSSLPSYDPAKHQHDASILVKDFYRPYSRASRPAWPNGSATRDPKPADFDSLMSIMNQRTQTPPLRSPTSPDHQRSEENSNPPLEHPKLPRLDTSHSGRSNNAPQLVESGTDSPRMSGPTKVLSNGLSQHPVNDVQPPSNSTAADVPHSNISRTPHAASMAPSRHSRAPSSHTAASQATSNKSKKDLRGLSKLLWKLGGGDMPVRRKIYIPEPEPMPSPPRQQQHPPNITEEEEDDYDEEACAAPVVGFGRGW